MQRWRTRLGWHRDDGQAGQPESRPGTALALHERGHSLVSFRCVLIDFAEVVLDIPMPGHPHQSAEGLRSNIEAWQPSA